MTETIISLAEGRARVAAAREAQALKCAEKKSAPAEVVRVVFSFDYLITFENLATLMETLVALGHSDIALDIRDRAIVVQS